MKQRQSGQIRATAAMIAIASAFVFTQAANADQSDLKPFNGPFISINGFPD